jgi:hypothetical protein
LLQGIHSELLQRRNSEYRNGIGYLLIYKIAASWKNSADPIWIWGLLPGSKIPKYSLSGDYGCRSLEHEVTNFGSDRSPLSKMANAAPEAMDKQHLQVLADRGYFNGPEIKACMEADQRPCFHSPSARSRNWGTCLKQVVATPSPGNAIPHGLQGASGRISRRRLPIWPADILWVG